MKVSICTISFRHQLTSLKEIATFARANGFDGIELWGVHARNLAKTPLLNAEWLATQGLSVPMVSDYLPTDEDERLVRARAARLCEHAIRWGAPLIRTFAGARGSLDVAANERGAIVDRLRAICEVAEAHGLRLAVETHPRTLADCLASTRRLAEEVDHAAFAINFDALHVWEGGDDVVAAHRALKPWIRHHHFKNVRGRADLGVFDPANVYAANGRREGMTPLFSGALDYAPLLEELAGDPTVQASLEWFGDDVFETLARDRLDLQARLAAAAPLGAAQGG